MTTPRQEMAKYITQAQQSQYFIDKVGFISAKSYGAAGDGVADDHTAIQNAINAASTAGNRMVWFPHGAYKNVGALTNDSSVRFIGDNVSITDSTYTVLDFSQMLTENSTTIIAFQSTMASFSTSIAKLYDYASTFASQISQLQTDTTTLRGDLSTHTANTAIHFTVANCTNADMLSYSTTIGGWAKIARGNPGQLLGMSTDGLSQTWYDSAQSLITAAGDIISGSTDGVPIRFAMGTADQILKVASAGDKLAYGNVSKSGTFSSSEQVTASSDYVLTVALGITAKTGHVIISNSPGGIHGCSVIVTNTASEAMSIHTLLTTYTVNIGHNGTLSDLYFGTNPGDIYLKSAVITGTNLVLTFHNSNVADKTMAITGTYVVSC